MRRWKTAGFLLACAGLFVLPHISIAQVVLTEDACLARAIDTMPGDDIVIDGTAGGIQVLADNPKRCAAVIVNSGVAPMRCAPVPVTVTATRGAPVGAGVSLALNRSSRTAWKCIRTTATSTAATIIESAVP